MNFFKKYLSRKLVTTYVFGFVLPIIFTYFKVSDAITLMSMGLAGAYLGANAMSKNSGSE